MSLAKRILLLVLFAVFTSGTSFSQEPKKPQENVNQEELKLPSPDNKDDDLNAEQIIEQNKPALVSVWYYSDGYYSYYYYTPKDTMLLSGSGFIFDKRGFVGTNYHVIDGIDSLLVKTSDGVFYNAELVFVDEKNDIAVLKILNGSEGKEFPVVKIGNSEEVRVGQSVYAIGSPLGFEYTISEGIVAALRENERVSFNDPQTYALIERVFDKVIQITAAISPGNSGGALFNGKGQVIGITTYSYGFYGNLNFAIAINSFSNLRNTIETASLEGDEEFLRKKQDNLFNTNFRLAENYKSKLYSNWYYTKQLDTMKLKDTLYVKQDSLNRINLLKAENYYNICINLRPDTFYVYQNMMDLYVYIEDFNKAEDLYRIIRERFESDSLLNTLSSSLAIAYSTSKDYKKALQFYEKIFRQDTNDVYILYQIASINELLKNYDKSVAGFKKLLKVDPNYTSAYVELGKIYYLKDDFKSAKKNLETALEKMMMEEYSYLANQLDLHYYLGLIAVKEGRKLDALLAYLDMKSVYTYTIEDNEKKLKLYKAIKKMDD